MSNQSSQFENLRNVPNQSSSFPRDDGTIGTVREVDGSPTLSDIGTLIVSDGTLSSPGAGVAIIDTTGSGAVYELREVTLTFPDTVAPGTAINIQTGTYSGGGPATLQGDTNVTLPANGALYLNDGRIEVTFNGQELTKGASTGSQEAQWVSTTQLAFSVRIRPGNQITVKAPFPVAS